MYGISHWIDKRGKITPERIALIDEHRKLTYLEMSKIVNHFAGVLQSTYSVKKGIELVFYPKTVWNILLHYLH